MTDKNKETLVLGSATVLIVAVLATIWGMFLDSIARNMLGDLGASVAAGIFVLLGAVLPFVKLAGKSDELSVLEDLLENERREAQVLLDISSSIFVVLDPGLKVGLVNKTGCRMLGISQDKILGKHWFNTFVPVEQRSRAKNEFSEVPAGKGDLVKKYQSPILTKSGKEIVIDWQITRLKDAQGNLYATLCSGLEKKAPEAPSVPQISKDEHNQQIKKLSAELVMVRRKFEQQQAETETVMGELDQWDAREEWLLPLLARVDKLSKEEIDRKIEHALEKFGERHSVDSGYIFLFSQDETTMDNTHIWSASLGGSEIEKPTGIPLSEFPWFRKKILAQEVINVPRLEELPEEASNEKRVFESQGIHSFIYVPIEFNRKPAGYIGFEAMRTLSWNDELIAQIQMMSRVFSLALKGEAPGVSPMSQDAEIEIALPEVEIEPIIEIAPSDVQAVAATDPGPIYQSLLRNLPEGAFTFDHDLRVTGWNARLEKITGVTSDQTLDKNLYDLFPFMMDKEENEAIIATLDGEESFAESSLSPFQETPEAEPTLYSIRHLPVKDESGAITGGMVLMADPAGVAGAVFAKTVPIISSEDAAAQEEYQYKVQELTEELEKTRAEYDSRLEGLAGEKEELESEKEAYQIRIQEILSQQPDKEGFETEKEALQIRIEELAAEKEEAVSGVQAELARLQEEKESLQSRMDQLSAEKEETVSGMQEELRVWTEEKQAQERRIEELTEELEQAAQIQMEAETQRQAVAEELETRELAIESVHAEREELEQKIKTMDEELEEVRSMLDAELNSKQNEEEVVQETRMALEDQVKELTQELAVEQAKLKSHLEEREGMELELADARAPFVEEMREIEARLEEERAKQEELEAARLQVEEELLQSREALTEAEEEFDERLEQRTEELQGSIAHLQAQLEQNETKSSALFEAEQRYKTLADNSELIVIYLSKNQMIVDFNQEAEYALGWQRELNIGETFFDLVLPQEIRATVSSQLNDELSHETSSRFESALDLPDGAIHLIQWTLLRQGEPEEEATSYVAIGRDVTDLKRFEKAERENEVFISAIIDNAADGFVTIDASGRIESMNPAAGAIFGRSASSMVGQNIDQLIPDSFLSDPGGIASHYLFSGKSMSHNPDPHEVYGRNPEGQKFPVEVSVGELYMEGERKYLCILRDAAAQRRLEQTLMESEDRFRQLFAAETDAIVVIDPNTRKCIDANESALELYEYTHDEFLNLTATEISAEPSKTLGTLDNWVPGKIHKAPMLYHKKKEGVIFLAEIVCGTFRMGNESKLFWVIRDVTDRQRVEDSLKENQIQMQLILNGLDSAVYIKDGEGRYEMVNKVFENHFNVNQEKIRGKTDHEIFGAEMADELEAIDQKVRETGKRMETHNSIIHEDGPHTYHSVKFPLRNSSGSMYALCGIASDVTQRLRDEDDLKQFRRRIESLEGSKKNLEKEIHTILENFNGVVYLKDAEGRYKQVNKQFESLYNKTGREIYGKTDLEVFPKEIVKEMSAQDRKVLNSGKREESEERVLYHDGPHTYHWTRFPLRDEKGALHSVFGMGVDVTDAKRAEEELKRLQEQVEEIVESRMAKLMAEQEQLIEKEKNSAVGDLSSSIATRVNTPIHGIRNVLEQVRDRVPMEEYYFGLVDLGLKECGRVTDLTEQLKACFGTQPEKRSAVNIHDAIDSVLADMRGTFETRKIDLEKYYSPEALPVQANLNQLREALKNILQNAEEAIPKGKSGIIRIVTEMVDGETAIRIQDNGCGVPPKNLKTIFNPFFTTKTAMKRAGMGLSASHGIIRGLGGNIQAQSQPAKGTTISLFLPTAVGVPETN